MTALEIIDLHASVEGKEILKGINLRIEKGEIHAIMGPNGSGKSTLSNIIMGHPKYEVTQGKIFFNDKNVLGMTPDERGRTGLFLSFQYPFEIQGLGFTRFLLAAFKARFPEKEINPLDLQKLLKEKAELLHFKSEMIRRELNVGFSGGEKKRAEILQMLVLQPSMALLDETDSGLDIDSLKLVSDAVNSMRSKEFSALIVTHYKRILNYLKPDFVHVLCNGKIIASGDKTLADKLEEKGYKEFLIEQGIEEKVVKEVEKAEETNA